MEVKRTHMSAVIKVNIVLQIPLACVIALKLTQQNTEAILESIITT